VATPTQAEVGALRASFARGDFAGVEAIARRLAQANPELGFAWNALGGALAQQGRDDEALEPLERAARLLPAQAAVHGNLAMVLERLGRIEEAQARLQRALEIEPGHADLWNNLGVILRRAGRPAQARSCYERVLAIRPASPGTWANLAILLREEGDLEAAESALRRAIALDPGSAPVWNDLGSVLLEAGRHEEARAAIVAAIERRPQFAPAHSNLGIVLCEMGRTDEAVQSAREAVRLAPRDPAARSNLLFVLNYAQAALQEYRVEARSFGELSTALAPRPFNSWSCHPGAARMRVGFVSGDLRQHPVGHFLEAVLAALDPLQIELAAFPTNRLEDELTRRIRPRFAIWHPIAGMNDERAAALIRSDSVHVLLDLAGHTAYNRLGVFSWRPAPVQASWLGYYASTGLAQIDAVLADRHLVPPGAEGEFTERLAFLPETRLCFTPPDAAVDAGPLPALAKGFMTFACFQPPGKIGEDVIATWSRVLEAVAGSRILFKGRVYETAEGQAALAQRFARHGVGHERLVFEGSSPRAQYLAAYRRVDLVLDPFPFPGGTTTAEALWMGVPVLTLAGSRMVARQGVSMMRNAGLPQFVAGDRDEYVRRAREIASDLAALAAVRQALRHQVLASPLFDAPRFARAFADLLRELHAATVESRRPAGTTP